jgi:HEAT repeat protein
MVNWHRRAIGYSSWRHLVSSVKLHDTPAAREVTDADYRDVPLLSPGDVHGPGVLEKGDILADPEFIMLVDALGAGRTSQVLEPLLQALKYRNALVRWSVASSLVRLRSRKAVEPLLAALADRSPMVQSEVVHALAANKFYRRLAAVDPLRRIVRNKRIRRHYPGLWREAREALASCTAP